MSSFQEDNKGHEGTHSRWFGYHLDLKPSNILITGKDSERTLVITDFGQAHFKSTNTDLGEGSSISPNPGGVTFAPPDERMNSKGHINRSFDVWSFGCILLEVAVYIIRGREELEKFRKDRKTATTPGARGNTACFYQLLEEVNGTRGFVLKRAVLDRIKSLRKIDHQFVDGIVRLIENIFQHQRDRPTARDAAKCLQDLLNLRSRDTRGQPFSIEIDQARKLRMGHGDVDLGDDKLKQM